MGKNSLIFSPLTFPQVYHLITKHQLAIDSGYKMLEHISLPVTIPN